MIANFRALAAKVAGSDLLEVDEEARKHQHRVEEIARAVEALARKVETTPDNLDFKYLVEELKVFQSEVRQATRYFNSHFTTTLLGGEPIEEDFFVALITAAEKLEKLN